MERVITRDGSPTLRSERWNCSFHSLHGAWTEAKHVYIEAGLAAYAKSEDQKHISVVEMGAGTGLNALLAAEWANQHQRKVIYHGLDQALPSQEDWSSWWSARPNESAALDDLALGLRSAWLQGRAFETEFFSGHFHLGAAQSWLAPNTADVLFYDAFSTRQQPELWTSEALAPWLQLLSPKGVLVTYCATGEVFRRMQALGFVTEHLPGPPGKREMLRARRG